jgi:hypothetical protein
VDRVPGGVQLVHELPHAGRESERVVEEEDLSQAGS